MDSGQVTDFIALVRTMRRDQIAFAEHRTSAAAMLARDGEKQVDDALAGMTMEEFRAIPEADEAVEVQVVRG